ncbi:uncharacterized protein LOC125678088 isoform X3 [Ostrea edulis]|uniref:uncharacterized protein LOC125678088 isoform X3 n=1 Tax=Ostrea edulis TaxID=37623 RepID=UPI0024AF79C5|nr:uncharacterized protein LOC125678088 isoform X3 [Ostrea edulis]
MMVIWGLFLLLFIRERTECTVLVQPSPIANVTYGKPLYFNCTSPPSWEAVTLNIPGETGFKFAIINGGQCDVPNNRRADYSIACHGNTLTYGIMKPRDNTIWRCTFSSSGVTEHGNTTVSLQADEPVILPQRRTYTIIEGSNISIPCTFTGAPIYNTTWEHDNIVMQWSDQTRPLVLSLQNVSRSAAGNYTCNVTVTFKGTYTASNTVNLIVEYPPTLKPSIDTTVNEGTGSVSLACEILVEGYPRNYSDLYWQHWIGSQLIRELASDTHLTIPTVKKYTLTLKSVSYNNTGRYVCVMGNGISNLDGKVEQTAQVELVVQDFPIKPFHIHFKRYDASAFLEWEAATPDLDMTYEVILKNYTGDDIINIIPGSNETVYKYWLTNLTLNKEYIIQLCTTNVVGRNCSSTFKIKMDKPISITLQANQMPISETTLISIVVGSVGLLNILVVVLMARNKKKHRKKKSLSSFERQNVPSRSNSCSMQRPTNDLETSENNCERTVNFSADTYLTPQCLTSPQSKSPSWQSNLDGNEYASVDDPTLMKIVAQRNHNVGIFRLNGGDPVNTGSVPNLPSRVTRNVSETMVTPNACPGNEYLEMEKTAGIPKSTMSPSLQFKIPNQTISEDFEFTHYVSMDDEDDKKSPEVQNGGYSQI